MTTMILPQISRVSSGSQFQSLAIAVFIALALIIGPLLSASLAMSTAEQKSFERLVRLALSQFDATPGDRANDFLSECQDWLCNLVIHESYGVAYTSY